MSNYFDDDDAFWDGPSIDPDRTVQIERVRRRVPERTRTHHVVRREQPLEHFDDGSSMWIDPSPPIAERLGPLGSIDPRLLSVGAVALAVVLAVPLFGALGDNGDSDALRTIEAQSTTTVMSTAAPETSAVEVVVTAAIDPDQSADSDVAPNSGDSASSADETDAETATQGLRATPDCSNQYTAAAGDYWLRIADGSGTPLDSLLEVNEATAETPIYPGSTICLPQGAAAPAGFAAPATGASSSADSSGSPAAVATEDAPCANRYESVAGDYWLRIGDAAGLELDELLALNDATVRHSLVPRLRGVPTGRSRWPSGAHHRGAGHGGAGHGPPDHLTGHHRPDHRPGDDGAALDDSAPDNRAAGAATSGGDRADHPRCVARRPRGAGSAHRLARKWLQPASAELLLFRTVPDLLRRPRQLARRAGHPLGRGPLRPAPQRHGGLCLVPALRRLGAVADDRPTDLGPAEAAPNRTVSSVAHPAHRPPVWFRAGFAVLGAGVLLFNLMLMLSDRAPGAMRSLGGDFVRRLFARIDASGPAAEVLADPRLPESDAIVHVAVWALAVGLIGLAVWTWRGLLVGAIAVLAASLVVEAAQGLWTDTREVETSDVRANAAGVVLGAVAVGACYLAYSAVGGLFRITSQRGRPTA